MIRLNKTKLIYNIMKYAIVEISGRQFWIETGKYYDFNRIPTELGKQITFNRVLLLNNEGNLLVGKPYLESVKIKGKILEHLRGKKTIVYKMRPKKKTRKKQGHRQELTRVFIEDIILN
jgi:large subunit ribosomal protein L21